MQGFNLFMSNLEPKLRDDSAAWNTSRSVLLDRGCPQGLLEGLAAVRWARVACVPLPSSELGREEKEERSTVSCAGRSII